MCCAVLGAAGYALQSGGKLTRQNTCKLHLIQQSGPSVATERQVPCRMQTGTPVCIWQGFCRQWLRCPLCCIMCTLHSAW